MKFDLTTFDVQRFDKILARGLSNGLGTQGKQVCIEAAICETLGLGHDDDPKCVAASVRRFKIRLNDSPWSSPQARAKGLRDLGLAQLGSKDVVDDAKFSKLIAEKTTRRLLPVLYRELWPNDAEVEAVAKRCESEGTKEAALAAKEVAKKKHAAYTADAAYAADAAAAAAVDAAYAAAAAARRDFYLNLSAQLALETLRELNSPGCALLT